MNRMSNNLVCSISLYLKNLRQNLGYKISEVARFCKVSHSYISMIENGSVLPSLKILYKLALLYNVPVDELLAIYLKDFNFIKEKLSDEDKEDIIKFRLSELFPDLFSKFSVISGTEMLKRLEIKFPEKFELLYKMAKESGENGNRYESIKNWLLKIPTITERMILNMVNKLPETSTIEEMIEKVKRTFGWTWERMAYEFGVSSRTIQRWAKKEYPVPQKAKDKLIYLYNIICKRLDNTVQVLQHLYPGSKSVDSALIIEELEKLGLATEIKNKFIKKYPKLKRFGKKKLSEFFYQFSKQYKSFNEIVKENENIKNSQINLAKIKVAGRNKKKRNNGRKRKRKSNNIGKEESDGEIDKWFLNKKYENVKIKIMSDSIFENLVEKFMAAGSIEDLQKKEVHMKIRKRPESPYYYVDICVKNHRFRMSTRTTNKKIAELIGFQILYRFWNTFEFSPFKNIPDFENASKEFLEHQKKKGIRSWKNEELCHKTLVPYLGKIKVDEITPSKIQETLEKIKETRPEISSRTLDYYRGYLHRFFEYLKNIKNYVTKNPVEKIPKIKVENKRTIILSASDEEILLKNITDSVVKDVVKFVLLTGLREGEVLNLKKENFIVEGEITFFRIKREKNFTITEFPVVWKELKEIVEKYIHLPGGYFFVYSDGKPIGKWKLIYEFQKAREKAGIKNIWFHDLRRTFYTRMKLVGCDYLILEYLMGHRLPEISSRYFSCSIKNISDELKKLEEKLSHYCPSKEEGERVCHI
jgi:integrase/transcriptional regulator with XRE-family HTH domain